MFICGWPWNCGEGKAQQPWQSWGSFTAPAHPKIFFNNLRCLWHQGVREEPEVWLGTLPQALSRYIDSTTEICNRLITHNLIDFFLVWFKWEHLITFVIGIVIPLNLGFDRNVGSLSLYVYVCNRHFVFWQLNFFISTPFLSFNLLPNFYSMLWEVWHAFSSLPAIFSTIDKYFSLRHHRLVQRSLTSRFAYNIQGSYCCNFQSWWQLFWKQQKIYYKPIGGLPF